MPARAQTDPIRYDFSAARGMLGKGQFEALQPALVAARKELFDDIDLLHSGKPVPAVKQPLDSGFIDIQGMPYSELLVAAIQGTKQAYAGVSRPTADIRLKRLDEHSLGQLFQMFMLATVLEGRLIGINHYGQPGIEAYKKNMGRILGL
jgi:glucose-6-phosphate isomerase